MAKKKCKNCEHKKIYKNGLCKRCYIAEKKNYEPKRNKI